MKTLEEIRNAKRLPAPEYANTASQRAEAAAIGRIRREGKGLWRVIAISKSGEPFGYDLPFYDAKFMARSLKFNKYSSVELFKLEDAK